MLTVSFNSATAGSATISVTAQSDDGVSISNALSVSTYAEYVTETDPNATVSISAADGAMPSVIHFENADATVALAIGSGAAAVDLVLVIPAQAGISVAPSPSAGNNLDSRLRGKAT